MTGTSLAFVGVLAAVSILEGVSHSLRPKWEARGIHAKLSRWPGMLARVAGAALTAVAVHSFYPGEQSEAIVPAAAVLAWVNILAADTDLGSSKIPREACHITAGLGLVFAVLYWPGPGSWLNLGLAFLVCVLLPFVAALLTRGGMGLGDIRLLWAWVATSGWWLGFVPLAWALIAGGLIGGVVRLLAIRFDWGRVMHDPAWAGGPAGGETATLDAVSGRRPRRRLPFAPSLAAGLTVATVYALLNGVDACSAVEGLVLSC